MKFGYILKNKNTGVVHKKIYTLNQIQEGGLSNLFDVENYAIIAINQFTGLADKNGKEIYEGDILKDKYSDLYIVFFKNGSFVYKSITEKLDLFYNLSNSNNQWEVIGNIYENSDLLK